ncbi:glycosyltransferase family 61 protein [Francisella philomiragia]|uniref:glycosyltransferase family 61 protein n=1 Tax=Francisella philomiragia TaxID=28110 RepID=UPI001906736A|nr:glycosyltransferase family 61 protein [Francisella philomiragia]MBK2095891.1 glycosyltransferase family 61 protein [Francisella philomiragia]
MTYKQILRIVHKFIPRFIREQFVNDAVAQYSEIKRLNKESILSAEKNAIEEAVAEEVVAEEVVVEECSLVNGIEELGCDYKLLSKSIGREITISGPKLVISGQDCQKSHINTELPDTKVYLLECVSVIGLTKILKNKHNFHHFELNVMDAYHQIKRPNVISKLSGCIYSLSYYKNIQKKQFDSKIYIYLLDEFAFNYYHFIIEVLPRFWYTLNILRQNPNFDIDDYCLLVDSRIADQCIQVLKALTSADITIHRVDEKRELFCKKLIYCSPLSYFLQNTINPPNMAKDIVIDEKCLLDVRDAILRSLDVKPFKLFSNKKIYLQRISEIRKIVNINDLELLLHRKGFEFINTGAMTIEEQISLMQHADIIVAPSGASLTNIIFMRPNTKVINIYPSTPGTNYNIFQQLASVADVDLVHFLTKPIGESTSVHADAVVDIESLELYLDNISYSLDF